MDFPSYVPNAVREWIADALEGDKVRGGFRLGWRETLKRAEVGRDQIKDLLLSTEDPDGLSDVRVKYARTEALANGLAEKVASLERLALRTDMQTAYERLVGVLELKSFIQAAWSADKNYSVSRKRTKEAAVIAGKVAAAASKLHDLLGKAEGLFYYLPSEFFSLNSLLRNTDHDLDDRNHYEWQRHRLFILGNRKDPRPTEANAVPTSLGEVIVSAVHETPVDPEKVLRSMLNYAWLMAPNVRHMVATMQRAAEECVPAERGIEGAAISSQKSNRKTQYLRGFAWLLRNEHHIELTANIMNAMAVTAAVVLNDRDIDVSYDDVRKAVASVDIRAAEDSRLSAVPKSSGELEDFAPD